MRGREKGLTLIEIMIAMTVGAMVIGLLVPATQMMMRLAPRLNNELVVAHDLAIAGRWLVRDTQASRSFTLMPGPGYGWFEWTDYSGSLPVAYKVTYYYDAGNTSLIREERRDGVIKSALPVARNILSWADVRFEAANGTITVKITSTAGVTSRSASIIAARRQ
ncbi:MAG: PulJ/GspJ family protein [Dehalococcoidia bacterium]|nr:hypothetical protein [Chloroflexota bacterium]MBT9162633.1 hypothetical protein [Chloroflexota bacterium]MBT9163812.1 hypothetical protein [Chloroflexota bacterium]